MTFAVPRTGGRRLRRGMLTSLAAGGLVLGAALPATAACTAQHHPRPQHTGTPLRTLARHDGIYVGSALAAGNLSSDPTYSKIASSQFDAVTPENEMKWASVEPTQGSYDWGPADQIVNYAEKHHMLVRGHNLVWNSQLPTWLTSGNFTNAQLAALLKKHITDEVSHFKGKIYAWDVINEPFNGDGSLVQDLWYKALGPNYIADALRWAHQADPHAKLYINDYNIEGVNAKSDAMYDLVKSLKAKHVPIDGVGLESHFIAGELPGDIQQNMRRFTKLGVNVAVTELDDRVELPATSAELTQQATDYKNVVTDCVRVRGCVGVTVWEFDDGHSWVPGVFTGQGAATPYTADYQAKPAYYAIQTALRAGGHQHR